MGLNHKFEETEGSYRMINWTDISMNEAYRRDLLRQAEQERLVREALSSSRRQHIRLFKYILTWLISWLG